MSIKRFLKFELFSSKVVSEAFFRRIIKSSPLTNSSFVCAEEGLRLFKMCFCIKDRVFLESCALYTTVYRTVSVSDISVVNLIAG